jgi:NAD(P)-dependent dehydrogenase (short-subunit alcohol dehydrogenase family)
MPRSTGVRRRRPRAVPVGGVGTTTDVAGAVISLPSQAASLVTGTVLVVDDGWTAR